MTINDVYKQFDTPRNLQRHMLDVAGIVCLIKRYWKRGEVNWPDVTAAALLHDLGNIVKFDLNAYPQLLGDEQPRIEYWRTIQHKTIQKYGTDDHEATDVMLQELALSNRIRQIISSKSFGNSVNLFASHDIESQLLLYCDLRVLPSGVGSLDECLKDIKARLPKYSERPDFNEMVDACYAIEKNINKSVSIDIQDDVDGQTVAACAVDLRYYEL
ncbi:hypothetical protein KBC31_05135 [Candidatus Saccharibacteria bacterium]|jgi:hypothetical protein|nr:hypothetical protein [Candidatus Saccharibacteria bacterium]